MVVQFPPDALNDMQRDASALYCGLLLLVGFSATFFFTLVNPRYRRLLMKHVGLNMVFPGRIENMITANAAQRENHRRYDSLCRGCQACSGAMKRRSVRKLRYSAELQPPLVACMYVRRQDIAAYNCVSGMSLSPGRIVAIWWLPMSMR